MLSSYGINKRNVGLGMIDLIAVLSYLGYTIYYLPPTTYLTEEINIKTGIVWDKAVDEEYNKVVIQLEILNNYDNASKLLVFFISSRFVSESSIINETSVNHSTSIRLGKNSSVSYEIKNSNFVRTIIKAEDNIGSKGIVDIKLSIFWSPIINKGNVKLGIFLLSLILVTFFLVTYKDIWKMILLLRYASRPPSINNKSKDLIETVFSRGDPKDLSSFEDELCGLTKTAYSSRKKFVYTLITMIIFVILSFIMAGRNGTIFFASLIVFVVTLFLSRSY